MNQLKNLLGRIFSRDDDVANGALRAPKPCDANPLPLAAPCAADTLALPPAPNPMGTPSRAAKASYSRPS